MYRCLLDVIPFGLAKEIDYVAVHLFFCFPTFGHIDFFLLIIQTSSSLRLLYHRYQLTSTETFVTISVSFVFATAPKLPLMCSSDTKIAIHRRKKYKYFWWT